MNRIEFKEHLKEIVDQKRFCKLLDSNSIGVKGIVVFLFILEGTGSIAIEDKTRQVNRGDVIFLPRNGLIRGIRATKD